MARPSKFCPATAAVIERGVRLGLPVEHAATIAGIVPSTVFAWLKDGKANRTVELSAFSAAVDRARAEAVCEANRVVWKAGDRCWRAAAKWLELMHSNEFGPRARGI